MMHEARDRQKFVSDAQYLRDMQHKVHSEYQACLRRQEKKRDQFCRQESSFERPRPSSISSSRQIGQTLLNDYGSHPIGSAMFQGLMQPAQCHL
ncbi:probable E3 ubiquitin-protein ligase MARCHF10 [Petaurus breviceps papuanus]|uniref:probable E3 ubiquitin-protein ligase MARCHF10 n=1 Tax=Petaurus breviceps papuanus TaxID=3040969 RepID=UPI0036DE42F2